MPSMHSSPRLHCMSGPHLSPGPLVALAQAMGERSGRPGTSTDSEQRQSAGQSPSVMHILEQRSSIHCSPGLHPERGASHEPPRFLDAGLQNLPPRDENDSASLNHPVHVSPFGQFLSDVHLSTHTSPGDRHDRSEAHPVGGHGSHSFPRQEVNITVADKNNSNFSAS